MTGGGAELFRATIFHTPESPFKRDPARVATAPFVCHEDGGLLVRGGRIAACGDFSRLRADHADAIVVDWRGGFVLPGLIDTHVHFPQIRIIGSMGRSLLDWLEQVALPEEARMADASYASATARAFTRALSAHGTTSAMVFGSHFSGATAALFDAAESAGLRITSGLVMSDRRLRSELHRSCAEAYRDSTELIRRYHKRGRLLYAVTPRFALSTTEPMLEVCQSLMAEHADVRLQTHINEDRTEVAEIARLFPWADDYLAVYERYRLVGRRSVFAHNVHASDDQLRRLATAGSTVSHCPASNAALGGGMFPFRRHLAAGVRCALGTDVGGGVGFGLLKEGLHAYLVQRVMADGWPLDAGALLYLATRAGAEALGLDAEVGDLCEGKAADFIHLRPPAGSVLEEVVRRAEHPADVLAAIFTLAGLESIHEVRVGGDTIHRLAG